MLDSVRCLMSVVMSPSADGPSVGHLRRRRSGGKVRVPRVSSRYPTVKLRSRMDSYGAAVGYARAGRPGKDEGRGNDDEDDSRRGDFDDDDDDEDDDDCDDDDPCSRTDTAAGCSSASDTDFYYEDRTGRHGFHKTVVELRAEEVQRTETVQEEFEDSLMAVDDARRPTNQTVEVVTKHRHVLSESCRVKVQNLRYT